MSSTTQPKDSQEPRANEKKAKPTARKRFLAGGVLLTLSRLMVRLLLILFFRYFPENKIKIPRKGPLLVIMNHQSFLDPILAGAIIPRKVTYFARSTLFRNRFFASIIRFYGAIPVDRGTATSFAGLKRAVEILREGNALVMFPDGTRSKDGELGEYKPGFVWLAQQSGAQILPMVISGANEAWNRNNRLPRPKKIKGRVLEIIGNEDLKPREDEKPRDAQARIASEIREMMEKAKKELEA